MDEYDKDRAQYRPHERGRIFENGTYEYFRDRESGFAQGSRKFRAAGVVIRFDKVKEIQGKIHSIEEKSGRLEGPKDEKQLQAVRILLEKNIVQQHELRCVRGEYKSKEVQRLIDALKRDYPDRFRHTEIPRDVARAIWAIGLQREVGRQIELPGVRETARVHAELTRQRSPEAARKPIEREATGVARELSAAGPEAQRNPAGQATTARVNQIQEYRREMIARGVPEQVIKVLGLGQEPRTAEQAERLRELVADAHSTTPRIEHAGRAAERSGREGQARDRNG
ncbi:hypothetical protein [Nocardia farcinica]|uniref:hypothetical protein n=1 Tax=Nocardia farcinica TaxID=37329 RepID=UPI001893F30C|nr:hypothetical protein [Nocardia farcinica]MBF6576917.1 hypothetical protein [Nocardia farcinica]